jgi:hypothetical protein
MFKNWLVSYPSSGSNLAKYCIENIIETEDNLLPKRIHHIQDLISVSDNNENVCFLIRSPLELCLRAISKNSFNVMYTQNIHKNKEIIFFRLPKFYENIERDGLYYKNDLVFPNIPTQSLSFYEYTDLFLKDLSAAYKSYFDFFNQHKGKKKVIYYEDLLINTDNKIIELAELYGLKSNIDELSYTKFFNEIDINKKQSLKKYVENSKNEPESDSKTVDFYQKKYDIESKQISFSFFKQILGDDVVYFDKYDL